jgi:protein-S-isoprenylcysteine O-methyltransferase Ste14
VTLLRLYLLAGLIAHKAVWEVLKRRQPAGVRRPVRSVTASAAKAVKGAILVAIVAQTMLPAIFPIAHDPLPLQLIGVPLYTVGLLVAVIARWQLGSNWADIEAAQILEGQHVVGSGIYRYLRHPIYTGDVLLLAGFELSLNSWLVLGVLALAPVVASRARHEERMLAERLPGYAAYCARTWRFVPGLW